MLSPRFHISNKLVRIIGQIEAAKEVVETAPIDETSEKTMIEELLTKKIYFGSHTEGNDLTINQTKQILEGPTQIAQNQDVQEVINYRRVINILDELSLNPSDYLTDWLRDIHAAVTYNILPPEKSGFFRNTQILMRDQDTSEVIFTPPQALEIQLLLRDFFEWLNSSEGRDVHPVIRSGITMYVLLSVHPFVEGNSAVSRFFSGLILNKEGYSIRKLLLFEEQLNNSMDDLLSLIWVQNGEASSVLDRDITEVIEVFAQIYANAAIQLKEEIKKIAIKPPLKVKVAEQVALSARQIRIIDFISENGRAVMKELKTIIPNVSEDTILRDLTALSKKGIIEKEGTTKASSYILKR